VTRTPHLFGIDLDGTLLTPRGRVAPRTRQAVHALLSAGHRVCFSTGRNLAEAAAVLDEVGHRDVMVAVSGAMTVDARDGRVLHRGHMHADLAADLCRTIEDCGEAAVAFQDLAESEADYFYSADRPVHRALEFWMHGSGQQVRRVPRMAEMDHAKTLRVSAVCGYAAAARIRTALQEKFSRRAYLHSIVVASEEAEIVEVFDPHVNKWHGLRRVADVYGIPHDHTVAAGDDTNDLPMLRHSGLGVAMGNARQEVKDAARRTIGRNEDDGLAAFLEEWLVQNP
jgi:5-amino-6-(5-phospho-D-ribitylamino)uracil phosphatase